MSPSMLLIRGLGTCAGFSPDPDRTAYPPYAAPVPKQGQKKTAGVRDMGDVFL